MKTIRVLHLASFIGNIGDNANHYGSRIAFADYSDYFKFEFTNEEIREYYWKHKQFNQDFVNKCNSYDLVVIGGGNYLEFHIHHSRTGTSIDIPPELIKKINPPIVFFSLGLECGLGYEEKTFSKSKNFIDYLLANPSKYFLSLRNDGAHQNLMKYFGKDYVNKFTKIPDSAFLLNTQQSSYTLSSKKKYIGINLAGDSLEIRFKSNHNLDKFISELRNFIKKIVYEDSKNIIFFSHIFSDYDLNQRVIQSLPDDIRRSNIIIAPLIPGHSGMKEVFGLYSQCEMIFANRFHSNVCSIALGIPVIGLYNFSQIDLFYNEIDNREMLIDLNSDGLHIKFLDKYALITSETAGVIAKQNKILSKIKQEHKEGMDNMINWLNDKL